MALSEFEIKKYEKAKTAFLHKRRPHPSIRDKCDLACRLTDQSVEVFEIRPQWDDPSAKLEQAIAKATFVRNERIWKIYWMDASLKWKTYSQDKSATTIEQVFDIIDVDENGAFFG